MPRPTYHQQVKKQKERVRKARQDEKQQRRATRDSASSGDTPTESAAPAEPLARLPS